MLSFHPRKIRRNGRSWSRVSIIFKVAKKAEQLRVVVHDALIRAAGYNATRHLNDAVARSGRKYRTYVRDPNTRGLRLRLKEYVRRGEIQVWIAGKTI